MEPETKEQEQARRFAAVDYLRPHGFRPLGGWLFYKDGKTYDLSAADLTQIERIEREGLCVTKHSLDGLLTFALDRMGAALKHLDQCEGFTDTADWFFLHEQLCDVIKTLHQCYSAQPRQEECPTCQQHGSGACYALGGPSCQ